MTKEESLLIPRYKVIAPWFDMLERFEVGTIFEHPYGRQYFTETTKDDPADYPHLFKKLEWYEERTDKELLDVKYVKRIGKFKTGEILKVAAPDQNGRIWHINGEIEFRFIKDNKDLIPVNESDYTTYINSLKK